MERRDTASARSERSQEVASWYFRLNGFLQVPEFVLHSDTPRRAITDADLLAVRFPHSRETLGEVIMTDDRWIAAATPRHQTLVVVAEIKAGQCRVNGPWTDAERGGMEKVIERIGFAPPESTKEISPSLYNTLQWTSDAYVVKYVAIGQRPNHEMGRRFDGLLQLTWGDIASFVWERFRSFGYLKGVHRQWPRFGTSFAEAVHQQQITSMQQAMEFVECYIREGEQGRM